MLDLDTQSLNISSEALTTEPQTLSLPSDTFEGQQSSVGLFVLNVFETSDPPPPRQVVQFDFSRLGLQ